MPPNSMCEWILGQNVVPRKKKKEENGSGLRQVVSLEVLTDDESESDVYCVSVPRGKEKPAAKAIAAPTNNATTNKKVRFSGDKPKSALKQSDSDSDNNAEMSESEGEATSEEESDPDPTCPCTKCINARRKQKKSKKAAESSAELGDDSEDEQGAIHAKHLAKKNAKNAKSGAAGTNAQKQNQKQKNQQQQGKGKNKKAPATIDSDDTTDYSEIDTPADTDREEDDEEVEESQPAKKKDEEKANKKQQQQQKCKQNGGEKANKKQGKQNGGDQAKNQQQGKKGNQKQQEKTKQTNKTRTLISESESDSESGSAESAESDSEPVVRVRVVQANESKKRAAKSPKKQNSYLPNAVPSVRSPDYLMPTRSSSLHVEHVVEVPNDPQPNAFYDNATGTMRVYHGPAYGNPNGMLYPRRVYRPGQALPLGVPHPQQNPWYNGFPVGAAQPPPETPSKENKEKKEKDKEKKSNSDPPQPPNPVPPPMAQPPYPSWAANPWFQGYGTMPPMNFDANFMTAPPANPENKAASPEASKSKPPKSSGNNKAGGESDWNTNMIPVPTIEITSPDGSPSQAASERKKNKNKNKSNGGENSSWGGGVQDVSHSKDSNSSTTSFEKRRKRASDAVSNLADAFKDIIARDKKDFGKSQERWSNHSNSPNSSKQTSPQQAWNSGGNGNNKNNGWGGSNKGSKQSSPQPDNSWGNTNNGNNTNATNNNNGWNSTGGNNDGAGNNGWGDTSNNNQTNDWNNNAGNDTSNDWNNAGNDTSNDWNTGGNDANNDGWGTKTDNNNNNADEWNTTPGGDATSDWVTNTSPDKPTNLMPGTWAEPVVESPQSDSNKAPSNASGGNVVAGDNKGKGKGKGPEVTEAPSWGDPTVAQSTDGWWDTEEGKETLKKSGAGDGGGGGSSDWDTSGASRDQSGWW